MQSGSVIHPTKDCTQKQQTLVSRPLHLQHQTDAERRSDDEGDDSEVVEAEPLVDERVHLAVGGRAGGRVGVDLDESLCKAMNSIVSHRIESIGEAKLLTVDGQHEAGGDEKVAKAEQRCCGEGPGALESQQDNVWRY